MQSAEAALARLCDPEAKVSAHYCIEEDGRIWRLVPEERRAWHAGLSSWRGLSDINSRSIGVELVNPGHEFGYRPFPDPQMESLLELARDILARRPIPSGQVLGHSDVAPLRKCDPGELFPWRRLAEAGIGLWPGERQETGRRLEDLLAGIGYGYLDEEPRKVIAAFQRHWRPEEITGREDPETLGIAAALLSALEAPGA
jgi:N-acetylmuramoyl-L-alanine amidase